jgi:hypothetical protein
MPVGNATAASRPQLPVRYVLTPDVTQKAGLVAKEHIGDHFEDDGVATLLHGMKFQATNALGVVKAEGKVLVDALWGDKETRHFSATIDTNKGTMTDFKSW